MPCINVVMGFPMSLSSPTWHLTSSQGLGKGSGRKSRGRSHRWPKSTTSNQTDGWRRLGGQVTVPKRANPARTQQCQSSRCLRPPRIRQASREGEMGGREEREENRISGWRIPGRFAIDSLTVQMGMPDQRGARTPPRSQSKGRAEQGLGF